MSDMFLKYQCLYSIESSIVLLQIQLGSIKFLQLVIKIYEAGFLRKRDRPRTGDHGNN